MKASDLACRLLRKANILRGSIWFFRRHFNVNGKGCFSHPQARWIAPCELCSYAKKRRIGVSHFETFRMTSIALNKRYEVFQYVLEMFRKIVCILPILTFLTMKIPQSFLPWGGGTVRETIRPLFSLPLYSKDNDHNHNNQHRCADAEREDEITGRAIFLIRRFRRRFRYRRLRGSRG